MTKCSEWTEDVRKEAEKRTKVKAIICRAKKEKKVIHDQNLSMKSVLCSLCNHSQYIRDTIYFAVINYPKFCIRCQMKTFAANECDNRKLSCKCDPSQRHPHHFRASKLKPTL